VRGVGNDWLHDRAARSLRTLGPPFIGRTGRANKSRHPTTHIEEGLLTPYDWGSPQTAQSPHSRDLLGDRRRRGKSFPLQSLRGRGSSLYQREAFTKAPTSKKKKKNSLPWRFLTKYPNPIQQTRAPILLEELPGVDKPRTQRTAILRLRQFPRPYLTEGACMGAISAGFPCANRFPEGTPIRPRKVRRPTQGPSPRGPFSKFRAKWGGGGSAGTSSFAESDATQKLLGSRGCPISTIIIPRVFIPEDANAALPGSRQGRGRISPDIARFSIVKPIFAADENQKPESFDYEPLKRI